jgi:hypothetical protein
MVETISKIEIQWVHRVEPLAATAAAATNSTVVQRLIKRLLRFDDQQLSAIGYILSEDKNTLLITTKAGELPWVEGITYLGLGPDSRLYLPTTVSPAVHLSLFEKALVKQFKDLRPPLAVLPQLDKKDCYSESRVISMVSASAIDRLILAQWLEQ